MSFKEDPNTLYIGFKQRMNEQNLKLPTISNTTKGLT